MANAIVKLNGVTFELTDGRGTVCNRNLEIFSGAAYDEIYNVYGRPSQTKRSIWHEWCKWCYDAIHKDDKCELWISSRTCMFFSISGTYYDKANNAYYSLWITYAHNRAYRIA